MKTAATIGASFAAALVGAMLMTSTPTPTTTPGDTATPAAASTPCTAPSVAGLNAGQVEIARRLVAAADRAKTGDRGAEIIVATGIVESKLRNLTYGDRDSVGVLQQRPSQGWRHAQDVDKGADDFMATMKGLGDRWKTDDQGDIAQAVQRSGHPKRYSRVMTQAKGIVAAIRGHACTTETAPAVPANVPANLTGVLQWAASQEGKPYVYGSNGPNSWDCSSFSRTAWSRAGVNLPRTAQSQRDYLAAGHGTRIPYGQEQPGDLVFWNSYLGKGRIGHVVMVRDNAKKTTWEAMQTCRAGQTAGKNCGVGSWRYDRARNRSIFEIWRPNQ